MTGLSLFFEWVQAQGIKITENIFYLTEFNKYILYYFNNEPIFEIRLFATDNGLNGNGQKIYFKIPILT